ncbi:hypothetical protein AB0P21_39320 [Kribbella sp. NPDC056861]|uniref:hypothetical protein n=1 Tax=Kribbella sp. NPDC056861 TaxID=3154857 RepID=UPI003421C24F
MPGDRGTSKVQWSTQRLVELLDEAIDSAGALLMRGAGLMVRRDPVRGVVGDEPEPPTGSEL